MKTLMRFVLPAAGAFLVAGVVAWAADNAVIIDPGSTITMKSKDIGGNVQAMQNLLCDPTTLSQCAAVSAGGAVSVAGPVTNAGTFAVQATLGAETTKVIGTVNQGTSPWVVSNGGTFAVQASVPTWAGGTLGAMANYGTSPGAVLVPGVNASVTASALPSGAATSANQTTELSSLATIVTNTGAAVPTTQSGSPVALITCDHHVFKHITSATDTLAVQGVTAQTVYICGYTSRAAGVATWFLENTASTNANCSSSNTQITGVATEAANTGMVVPPGPWSGLKNTAANGLCINSTGTGGVDIDIWYTQF